MVSDLHFLIFTPEVNDISCFFLNYDESARSIYSVRNLPRDDIVTAKNKGQTLMSPF